MQKKTVSRKILYGSGLLAILAIGVVFLLVKEVPPPTHTIEQQLDPATFSKVGS